ncbi:hypothetical protein [Amycolatopsis thermoflava]|uniref:hypothetical protein n=1 Tax=Amycolatopsis thermoflava TaxID=84480 RepID=UPI003D739A09
MDDRYRYTSRKDNSDTINEHLNEMAEQGWDLVNASSAYDGTFLRHHFYWQRRG